jgi:hypothetical protein
MTRTPEPPKRSGAAATIIFLCLVVAASGVALDLGSAPVFGLPAIWFGLGIGAGAAAAAVLTAHVVRLALKARRSGSD